MRILLPGTVRRSCHAASTTVIVLPVPGGPKMRWGSRQASPGVMMFTTAVCCSKFSPTKCQSIAAIASSIDFADGGSASVGMA